MARALPALPLIDAAFEQGQISYSKVRAMTRVATPENEEYLLDIARHGTAAHVERVVRKYRRCRPPEEASTEPGREPGKEHFYCYTEDEGSVVFGGRLSGEQGQLLLKALAAGRCAQEINLSTIGGDAGVSHNTVRAWISALEASFVIFRLPAWHGNLRKQLVKTPKLHFLDSGLACRLLGIRSADELRRHPLRGAIFESWVAAEIFKHRTHRGETGGMFHFRATRGPEVDIVIRRGLSLIGCEVKSATTMDGSFLRPLQRLEELLDSALTKRLVFGGGQGHERSQIECIPWRELHQSSWL